METFFHTSKLTLGLTEELNVYFFTLSKCRSSENTVIIGQYLI